MVVVVIYFSRLSMTTVLITEQEGYMSDSMTDGHRGGACAGQRHPAGCGQTLSVFITQEAPLGWRLKHIVLLDGRVRRGVRFTWRGGVPG